MGPTQASAAPPPKEVEKALVAAWESRRISSGFRGLLPPPLRGLLRLGHRSSPPPMVQWSSPGAMGASERSRRGSDGRRSDGSDGRGASAGGAGGRASQGVSRAAREAGPRGARQGRRRGRLRERAGGGNVRASEVRLSPSGVMGH